MVVAWLGHGSALDNRWDRELDCWVFGSSLISISTFKCSFCFDLVSIWYGWSQIKCWNHFLSFSFLKEISMLNLIRVIGWTVDFSVRLKAGRGKDRLPKAILIWVVWISLILNLNRIMAEATCPQFQALKKKKSSTDQLTLNRIVMKWAYGSVGSHLYKVSEMTRIPMGCGPWLDFGLPPVVYGLIKTACPCCCGITWKSWLWDTTFLDHLNR